MNEIVSSLVLAGGKYIHEFYLRFCLDLHIVLVDDLQETKKEYKNLNKQEIHDTSIKTNQIKLCLQHNMTYGDFKYLTRRTASNKKLCDKSFNIAKNPKYNGY